jgi:ABC-2 type transport system ATP-binding protein
MFQVKELIYEYPGVRALDRLTFSIETGSITALVGPNGAGKTTLLQCLAALIKPFAGQILIGGRDISREPRKIHAMVGYLPDFFGLYDRLTVTQALSYFALAQKVTRAEIPDIIDRVIQLLNLKEKRAAQLGSLSRGMRQRLAIGQALVHDPAILLLDEPASGLDPEARNALADLFRDLNARGKTIVVSSHILAELDQYASNLLILKKGRLVDREATATAPAGATIHIEIIGDPEDLLKLLGKVEQVSRVTPGEKEIVIDFTGNQNQQCELLQSLIKAKVPVTAFYAAKDGVQEQYLKTMYQVNKDDSIQS